MEPHYRAHAVYINSLPPSIAISCCLPSSSQLNHLEKEKQVNGCMQSCHITMPPCGYILQKCTRYRAQKGQTPKEEKERRLSIKACTIDQQFSVQRPAHIWVTSQFFHPSPPLLMSEWLGVTGNHFKCCTLNSSFYAFIAILTLIYTIVIDAAQCSIVSCNLLGETAIDCAAIQWTV